MVVAVMAVPGVGFWLAIRQDSVRWHRERRADLYIDLLVEADAERKQMLVAFTRHEMAEIDRECAGGADRFPSAVEEFDAVTALHQDTHLGPLDRALLGARANAYASRKVIRLFNELQLVGMPTTRAKSPTVSKWRADQSFTALEDQIKRELRGYAPWRERRQERQ